jgi:septal ring factor EnvC (AmiA/AmiB activator)
MSRFDKNICFRFFILSLLLVPLTAVAQDKMKQLENHRIRLEKSIEYNQVLLNETRAGKNASLEELAILNEQIEKRQKLIENYTEERNARTDTIFGLLFRIDKMAAEVETLKKEYAAMIYSAYKNNNTLQRMLYVLAAEDFNQARRRLAYYRVYASKRKQQAELIKEAEQNYLARVDSIEQKVNQTEILLARLETEQKQLQHEKDLKALAVNNLQKQEKELIKKQNRHKKRAEELKKEIEQMVADHLAVQTSPANERLDELIEPTPEDETTTNNFADNKGHLPWPVEKGVVSAWFGEHKHPDLKDIKVRNNGINIISQQGAEARTVFNGEVTRVMTMPGFNRIVIIRHENFLTVYTNLDEVFVEPGSKVKTKEPIGVIHTDPDNLKTELHFEIWKGKTLLDPKKWLASDRSSAMIKAQNLK